MIQKTCQQTKSNERKFLVMLGGSVCPVYFHFHTWIGLLYFAQDAQVAHWMYQCAIYVQDSLPMRKIVLLSLMRNICARFAQDLCKICARLQLFLQCAIIYTQDLRKIVLISSMHNICARLYLFPQCTIYAQDCTYFLSAQYMRKIVILSPMHNICTRLHFFLQCTIYAQDCTYFSNVQYMHKICA